MSRTPVDRKRFRPSLARRAIAALALSLLVPCAAYAANRYVATTGTDAGDCSAPGSPCLTLQYAINQASANDAILVAAGTYTVAGLVTVNKTLTIRGAQAGVDARTRAATESILSNSQGMSVSASNVVIDGFTIQDSTNTVFTGYGVWLNPGIDGTQILNNIFQNNIIGLNIANAGTTQALVQHNLFKTNNQPGPAFGTGIYFDQYTSGVVSNVLIDANAFNGNANAGIGLNGDPTSFSSNFEISNNAFDSNGRGIYASAITGISIHGNTIANATSPTDGGTSTAIGAFGGITGMSILNNTLQDGNTYGIRVLNFIGPGFANTGIEAHYNNITGYASAGLINQDTTRVNATCNWWGSATGPTTPANPGGTGDFLVGEASFNPWLIAPAPGGACVRDAPKPVPTQSPFALLLTALSLAALAGFALARARRG